MFRFARLLCRAETPLICPTHLNVHHEAKEMNRLVLPSCLEVISKL